MKNHILCRVTCPSCRIINYVTPQRHFVYDGMKYAVKCIKCERAFDVKVKYKVKLHAKTSETN